MTEITVDVREFRAHLSEYLREIKRGKTLVITERGQPVARLVPNAQPLAERVEALRRAGLLTWNGKKLALGKPLVSMRRQHDLTELISDGRE